ncbi:MAG: VOC family protein [Acidobacteriota bacterium]|nr:VOC family protein [Acidobacteriota bacterium]
MIAALLLAATVQFDHLWIVVSSDAPERAILEKAGFRIAPEVNKHDGQGTASIMVEFHNSFLELMWPDPTVPINRGMERAAEKFRQRKLWRTSGWSPIGIVMHRVSDDPIPFPTWSISPAWMAPGTAMVMLVTRDDATSPSLSVHPATTGQEARAMQHPIGVKNITAIGLIAPKDYRAVEALPWLEKQGVLKLDRGDAWAVEVTFDKGEQGRRKDFRPDLPLLIRY